MSNTNISSKNSEASRNPELPPGPVEAVKVAPLASIKLLVERGTESQAQGAAGPAHDARNDRKQRPGGRIHRHLRSKGRSRL